MREKIWRNFCNQRFKAFYLNVLNSKLRQVDLTLNFVMALATTGSVAAWAVWKQVPWLWITICGVSQFVVVAKPFSPYLKDLKKLTEEETLHDNFALEFEKLWLKVESGSNNNYDAEFLKLYARLGESLKKFQDLDSPDWEWLKKAAREKRNAYLKVNYGG